ncbi:non-homologous end-joining DNA ligase [Streptomyces beihaiensis]|uniref:DNA ligase (ATP) n=1 Tax=Streptomyces beihaiensis TaxID=2984495 RepID=A0ABT3TQ54_9ACTN|nr:non-homologous end-joining DNA ligase [Streptomyces beihaiensis]MCX3058572.1 non-homologous end-joining DNA ligase [Streptomyces beihaiensis]
MPASATTDLFDTVPPEERTALRRTARPESPTPMLATLTERYFSDPGWIFERKLDGVRCLAFRDGTRAGLLSRSGQKLGDTYPEITDALARQDCDDFVVDGEMVAFDGSRTSFARLQQRSGIHDRRRALARARQVAVTYYVFDLLYLAGHDVTGLPLRTRKALLRRALDFSGPLRFTPHRNTVGEEYLSQACERGWEGVIAKRADSRYEHRRSTKWLKFKCSRRQELVIGGYTDPEGSRTGFGALLVGHYEGRRLVYAGKVGTGYNRTTLADLRARMDDLAQDDCPFAQTPRARGTHWTRPELVAEIAFTEWTDDGKLRHPRFIALRGDKPAKAVVRERPGDRARENRTEPDGTRENR